jgi:hypothetical protein
LTYIPLVELHAVVREQLWKFLLKRDAAVGVCDLLASLRGWDHKSSPLNAIRISGGDVLSPAEAGYGRWGSAVPQSYDWGYHLTPADAGYGRWGSAVPQSYDWGYHLTPADAGCGRWGSAVPQSYDWGYHLKPADAGDNAGVPDLVPGNRERTNLCRFVLGNGLDCLPFAVGGKPATRAKYGSPSRKTGDTGAAASLSPLQRA